jgi:predicted peroxiredoxin|tara:strand:+ start:431 stop:835 length:405 start_codon:yes stop_codon:yes gene_type:complete
MNTIKFDKKTLEDIFKKIALGNSIKSVLDEMNLSYEGFRKTIRKSDKLKKLYDDAKEDGVELLLSESNKKLEEAINEFKANGKGDLATSHLIKEFVQLNKWKASKLLGKYNDNAQKLQLSNADNKPLIVKWDKS